MTEYAELQKAKQGRWVSQMEKSGAYWHHDGNLKRPFALLTSGKISNFFANCSVVTRNPALLEIASHDLLMLLGIASGREFFPDVFVGSAYGAITLAYELGRHGEGEAWFTIKGDDGEMKLDRFEFDADITSAIAVEDVISTYKTTRSSIAAIKQKAEKTGVEVLPYVLTLVNRSGQEEIDGFRIISLIDIKNALVWDRGENPFLGKEAERLEPVRPKQNWAALTADYPA